MVEWSQYWGGTATGDASSAPYSDDEFSDLWAYLFTYDRTIQGVVDTARVGYTGLLEVTNPSTSVLRVATGIAMVDGKVYTNTANIDETMDVPLTGTNYFTVVLTKNFAAQTVRVDVKEAAGNSNGGASTAVGAPAVTQTDGTTWEISLATVTITVGPVVTITDTREFLGGAVNTENIVDEAVTAAKIADRTRVLFIPALYGENVTDGTFYAEDNSEMGLEMPDSKLTVVYGHGMIPNDFVSGVSARFIVRSGASGNIYGTIFFEWGAIGQVYDTHTTGAGDVAVGVTFEENEAIMDVIAGAGALAIGDFVSCRYQRNAVDVLDTIGDSVWALGWLIEYTADS